MQDPILVPIPKKGAEHSLGGSKIQGSEKSYWHAGFCRTGCLAPGKGAFSLLASHQGAVGWVPSRDEEV